VLATLRARLAPRLQQAGIAVDWPVADLPAGVELGAERALQVMSIVQETIANVLEHARARTLRVLARVSDGSGGGPAVLLRVEDDGGGIPAGAEDSGGRGLANMRRRAARLGARFEVRSDASGTSLRLELPLAQT
jgi:signal transduction histidine kinase